MQLLKKDGWILKRTRGSHQQYAYPEKQGIVTLSFHSKNDDLHPKTASSILRQAKLKEIKD